MNNKYSGKQSQIRTAITTGQIDLLLLKKHPEITHAQKKWRLNILDEEKETLQVEFVIVRPCRLKMQKLFRSLGFILNLLMNQ